MALPKMFGPAGGGGGQKKPARRSVKDVAAAICRVCDEVIADGARLERAYASVGAVALAPDALEKQRADLATVLHSANEMRDRLQQPAMVAAIERERGGCARLETEEKRLQEFRETIREFFESLGSHGLEFSR